MSLTCNEIGYEIVRGERPRPVDQYPVINQCNKKPQLSWGFALFYGRRYCLI